MHVRRKGLIPRLALAILTGPAVWGLAIPAAQAESKLSLAGNPILGIAGIEAEYGLPNLPVAIGTKGSFNLTAPEVQPISLIGWGRAEFDAGIDSKLGLALGAQNYLYARSGQYDWTGLVGVSWTHAWGPLWARLTPNAQASQQGVSFVPFLGFPWVEIGWGGRPSSRSRPKSFGRFDS